MKKELRDLTLPEIEKEMAAIGQKPMRARQVFTWLNARNVDDFAMMTDLPKELRDSLSERFRIGRLECEERLVSADGTEKYLWGLEDGNRVETVLIREGARKTLCLSTQVGCRYRCPFCASGKLGYKRDLSVSEIVSQVLYAGKLSGEKITNVVFMGIGEPLDNIANLQKAIRLINDRGGIGIGARKITVSTCGILPGIEAMAGFGLQVELSVSLHAVSDKVRDILVPANRKYPLKALIRACKSYYEKTGRIITLEYTPIEGLNDSRKHAFKLAEIAREIKGKVNLIPCNAGKESAYVPAGRKTLIMFRDILVAEGVTATVRKSKGEDILAACGQLAGKKR